VDEHQRGCPCPPRHSGASRLRPPLSAWSHPPLFFGSPSAGGAPSTRDVLRLALRFFGSPRTAGPQPANVPAARTTMIVRARASRGPPCSPAAPPRTPARRARLVHRRDHPVGHVLPGRPMRAHRVHGCRGPRPQRQAVDARPLRARRRRPEERAARAMFTRPPCEAGAPSRRCGDRAAANSIESTSTTRPAAVSSTTRGRRSTIGSGDGAPRGAASIAWAASAAFWPTIGRR